MDNGLACEPPPLHGGRLVEEAAARSRRFHFSDVVENPQLGDNVRSFFARPFVYRRVREAHVPPELQVSMQDELTDEALRLVEHQSRLDRHLWLALATERIGTANPAALGDDIFR